MIPASFTPTIPGLAPGMTPDANAGVAPEGMVSPQAGAGKGAKDLRSGGSDLDFAAILAAGQQQFQLPQPAVQSNLQPNLLVDSAQNGDQTLGAVTQALPQNEKTQSEKTDSKLQAQLQLMSALPAGMSLQNAASSAMQAGAQSKLQTPAQGVAAAGADLKNTLDSLSMNDEDFSLDSEPTRPAPNTTWKQGLGGAEFLGLREQTPVVATAASTQQSATQAAAVATPPSVSGQSELAKADSGKTTRSKSKTSDDGFKADQLNPTQGQAQVDAHSRTQAVNQVRESAATVTAGEFAARGAERRERVSTLDQEGLKAIGMRISETALRGGGEMKIRLNPEHLGELQVRVSMHGKEVGVKFETSSEEAKNILQSSIQDLRSQLATHQLTLGDVDLSVSKFAIPVANGADAGSDTGSQLKQHTHSSGGLGQGFVESDGRNQRDRSPNRADSEDGDWAPIRRRSGPSAAAAAQFARSVSGGRRLDVQA